MSSEPLPDRSRARASPAAPGSVGSVGHDAQSSGNPAAGAGYRRRPDRRSGARGALPGGRTRRRHRRAAAAQACQRPRACLDGPRAPRLAYRAALHQRPARCGAHRRCRRRAPRARRHPDCPRAAHRARRVCAGGVSRLRRRGGPGGRSRLLGRGPPSRNHDEVGRGSGPRGRWLRGHLPAGAAGHALRRHRRRTTGGCDVGCSASEGRGWRSCGGSWGRRKRKEPRGTICAARRAAERAPDPGTGSR